MDKEIPHYDILSTSCLARDLHTFMGSIKEETIDQLYDLGITTIEEVQLLDKDMVDGLLGLCLT